VDEAGLARYREFLGQGLYSPGVLEIWVMDRDGSHKRQVTKLGAASFAPYFHPDGKRIVFSSNHPDPKGRNFDIFMIGDDGNGLERVASDPTFDGFPMFSPDGKRLVFASNRGAAARARPTCSSRIGWSSGRSPRAGLRPHPKRRAVAAVRRAGAGAEGGSARRSRRRPGRGGSRDCPRSLGRGFPRLRGRARFRAPRRASPSPGFPLAWFGLYDAPTEPERSFAPADRGISLDWAPDATAAEHAARVEALHERIAAGDTYQVNLTFPLRAAFGGDPVALFSRLRQAQLAGYAAYLDTGRFAVASVSPELFFDWHDRAIVTRPMKGTAPRGPTPEEDELRASALRDSAKDRAENLMIVDMLRNDLGRVAEPGSVRVPELFRIERYPTLLQMTSTVTRAPMPASPRSCPRLFPVRLDHGSAQGLDHDASSRRREANRVGSTPAPIGYAAPGRRACFSVAIRTVVVDRQRGEARYGVGSGIVADSGRGRRVRASAC
jgi:hypothetical protein